MPVISGTGGQSGFRVIEGTLYRASEYARTSVGASLLVIDEINRGPSAQVFGGSLVAIESDKRLSQTGSRTLETQFFEILDPQTGEIIEYALPFHLYILAAMNQADTSVEPLDVAFLRRWAPYRLEPNIALLRTYFGIARIEENLPDVPSSSQQVYEAAIRAWESVNRRIRIGRGPEFQIGHGVLMVGSSEASIDEALSFVAQAWEMIRAHIDEVFFGDIRGVAETLNVGNSSTGQLYTLEETLFADEPRLELIGPRSVKSDIVYRLLLAVA